MEVSPPIFNPLDRTNLATAVVNALLEQEPIRLTELRRFEGAGVYAMYYSGAFDLYEPLLMANRENAWRVPIYIGKAIPAGGRKGAVSEDHQSEPALFKRLTEHQKSIVQAANLEAADFFVRYLRVDDLWIPLGERLAINRYTPLWNYFLDGFGNHAPGKGRSRACGHSGFPLGLISDSSFQNGGLNERAAVCGVGHLVAAA